MIGGGRAVMACSGRVYPSPGTKCAKVFQIQGLGWYLPVGHTLKYCKHWA
jgi:hypothetical protein